MKKSLPAILQVTAAFIVLSACSTDNNRKSELASNYPPDYAWGEKCGYDETFTVCRSQSSNSVYLRIDYRGYLKDAANVSIYIKYNGKEAVLSGFSKEYDGSLRLRLANGFYNCRGVYSPTGSFSYDCQSPTAQMKDLLYYARDQIGRMNASDIELAVFDDAGNWDSRFGENYRYHLNTSY